MQEMIKTFILGKDDESDGRQDALRFDIEKGLFAVADGVSNSFHPEIVAKALCDLFVASFPEDVDNFMEFVDSILIPQVKLEWNNRVRGYMSTLSGRLLRHEQYNYETWKVGASTFCGVFVDKTNKLLHYFIVGDSTLFIHDKEDVTHEFNSTKSIEDMGGVGIEYTNTTDAILSDGTIVGNWLIGKYPLENIISIALMTDGMAKWYQKGLIEVRNPEGILWRIQNQTEFDELATQSRNEGEMDDDLAVILIDFVGNQVQAQVSSEIVPDKDEDASTLPKSDDVPLPSRIVETLENLEVVIEEDSNDQMRLADSEHAETADISASQGSNTRDVNSDITNDNRISIEALQDEEDSGTLDKQVESGNPVGFDSPTDLTEDVSTNSSSIPNELVSDTDDSLGVVEEEKVVSNMSIMDKLKATLRIWRNFPTDPTK